MGFDLWSSLGISRETALWVAVGGLVAALLAAGWILVRRGREDDRVSVRLDKE